MANWKKIIVSGSQAILANVKADNLTAGTVLIGGTSGLIQNSGITFASSTYSFGATSLVATGASSALQVPLQVPSQENIQEMDLA